MCNLVHLDKFHSEFLMCVTVAPPPHHHLLLATTPWQREFNALSCISAFCIPSLPGCLAAWLVAVADNAFVYLTALSALVAFA